MRNLIILALVCFLMTACNNKAGKKEEVIDTTEIHEIKDSTRRSVDSALHPAAPGSEAASLLEKARLIMTLIRDKNFRELATFVSPVTGLRFSAHGYVDTTDIFFSKEKVAGLWTDNRKYAFPEFSDEPRPVTFREYYQRDVYDKDFVNAPQVAVNKELRGPTPGISNLAQVYPNASHVHFYVPAPTDSELDWATLSLVFVKENGNWYLRHILHDNWTP